MKFKMKPKFVRLFFKDYVAYEYRVTGEKPPDKAPR